MNPVLVTREEELESKKIENLTVKEIKDNIEKLIETFQDKDLWKDIYRKDVKYKNKAKHVEFHYTLIDNDIAANADQDDDQNEELLESESVVSRNPVNTQ